ncbi:hypothetical protein KUTeg_000524 [Tegillarca granosa]|uniref:Uncharacterized protein n=1 Tax=Tegillarca granosa TaxID=220873 RepID=A0ABQ9FXT4_TEGGR|nr:hypothetical protein KUTeg_000524 [Tegillarca granosa]
MKYVFRTMKIGPNLSDDLRIFFIFYGQFLVSFCCFKTFNYKHNKKTLFVPENSKKDFQNLSIF